MEFDIIKRIKKFKTQFKITFLSAIIFGLVSQGMGIFNKYSFSDDIGDGFNGLGATITSGRWMLEALSRIELFIFGDGHFSMPLINGLVSLILIGLVACILVEIYEIKNNTLCIIVGGFLSTFPTITGIFNYMFTAPSYMFSLFIGTLGCYLTCKNDNYLKILIGIVLMGCCVGIYQGFIPFLISMYLIYLIKICAYTNIETSALIKQIIKAIICIAEFVIFYFIVNKIILFFGNYELTSYQSINTMGKDSISDYLFRIVYAYAKFFLLDETQEYYVYYANIKYIYYLIMAFTLVLMFLVLSKKTKQNKINGLLLALMFIAIPLASNFMFVMVDPSYVHALMVYGQTMPFVLVAVLLDNLENEKISVKYISKILTILLIVINIMFCRFDNECYLKAEFTQQEAISYFTTLVTRIKSADNYDDELPVSFVFIDGGRIKDESMYSIENLDYIHLIQYDDLYLYVNNYEWKNFMKRWCGYNPQIIDGSDLVSNQEVLNMTCYPDYGSIKVVDNRVVVRFQ